MRPVPRVKKHAVATLNSTRVMKGVASLNRNQAITHGGKEIELSLIVAAEHGREPGAPSAIGRLIAGSIEDGDHGCSLAGGYALFSSPVYEPPCLYRYQPHLPEAIENSPELRPRHKAHGSIRIQEGQPKILPHNYQHLGSAGSTTDPLFTSQRVACVTKEFRGFQAIPGDAM